MNILLHDSNLSPYSRDVAVRNITCKLKVLDDIRVKFRSYGNVAKVKKDKMVCPDEATPKPKKAEVSKLGQVNISTDPLERINAPWLEKLSAVVYLTH